MAAGGLGLRYSRGRPEFLCPSWLALDPKELSSRRSVGGCRQHTCSPFGGLHKTKKAAPLPRGFDIYTFIEELLTKSPDPLNPKP